MNYLDDRAFQATIVSQLNDRTRRGMAADFQAIAGELLDIGIVPQRQELWTWARQVCGGAA